MSVYNNLPFCDVCGYPYKDGKPQCGCEQGWNAIFAWADRMKDKQEEHDDEAVVRHCSELKSNCS